MRAEELLYKWAAGCIGKEHGNVIHELTGLDYNEATLIVRFILSKNGISNGEGVGMAAVIGDALLIGAFAARERMKQ